MALYYNLVFGLLVVEVALFTVLSLPLPSKIRRPLIHGIAKPFQQKEVSIAIKCILIFILILFVDSVNRVNAINEELRGFSQNATGASAQSASLITDRSEIQARKFYAQRNLYLTGFTLFQTLIVTRTYNLVYELLNLKDEVRSNGAHSTSNEEVTKLKAELTEKTENLEILKKQAESLRRDYDQLSEEQLSGKDTVEPISDKKSD
jgi:hypothetical protein